MKYEFNDVYNSYYRKVRNYIYKRISYNHNDVDDVTSNIFIKIYKNLDRFNENPKNLNAWIITITINTLNDFYRTNKKLTENHYTISSVDSHDGEIVRIIDKSNDVNKKYTDGELIDIIKTQIPKLDSDHKNANNRKYSRAFLFEKYFIDNMHLKEISKEYDINIGTVKSSIFTSRKLMREMLIGLGITLENY